MSMTEKWKHSPSLINTAAGPKLKKPRGKKKKKKKRGGGGRGRGGGSGACNRINFPFPGRVLTPIRFSGTVPPVSPIVSYPSHRFCNPPGAVDQRR